MMDETNLDLMINDLININQSLLLLVEKLPDNELKKEFNELYDNYVCLSYDYQL